MNINKIREEIAIAMDMRCAEQWFAILDNTDPGHYGVEIPDFQIDLTDIWVDVPTRTFRFRDGTLSFGARLGSSNPNDGADMDFTLTVSGEGKFDFGTEHPIEVESFSINESLDLFGDHVRTRAGR